MKRVMCIVGAAVLLLAGPAAAAQSKGGSKGGGTFKFKVAEDVQFKDAEGLPGIQVAPLWGDMGKNGDWGALIRFKAGTDSGWHHHSAALHLVMLSGTLTIEPEGGKPTELRTNAYVDEPAKVKHRTMCATEDCVFVLHGSKKFDFVPVKDAMAGKGGAGKAEGGMEKKGTGPMK
jgi:hypothetical protein